MQADSQADYTLVSEILASKLARHPRGAFFLFFHARFQLVQVSGPAVDNWTGE